MAKKHLNIQKRKQKNFSFNRTIQRPQTLLQAAINLSLASGDPIPFDTVKRESEERSARIPEEIKKEFRDRLRAGDLSVWQDENLIKYIRQ